MEVLAEKDYSIGRLMEIKEKVQEQLALVAKSKKELKREENLIDSILYGEGKAQMIERTMPEPEIPEISDIPKQNTKETDIPEKEIELDNTRKGGDAEKGGLDTAHMEKQPVQNEKQTRPEQCCPSN